MQDLLGVTVKICCLQNSSVYPENRRKEEVVIEIRNRGILWLLCFLLSQFPNVDGLWVWLWNQGTLLPRFCGWSPRPPVLLWSQRPNDGEKKCGSATTLASGEHYLHSDSRERKGNMLSHSIIYLHLGCEGYCLALFLTTSMMCQQQLSLHKRLLQTWPDLCNGSLTLINLCIFYFVLLCEGAEKIPNPWWSSQFSVFSLCLCRQGVWHPGHIGNIPQHVPPCAAAILFFNHFQAWIYLFHSALI